MEPETVEPKATQGDLLRKEARLELGLDGCEGSRQWDRQ